MASIVYQVLDTLDRCLVPEMNRERIINEKIPTTRNAMKKDKKEKWDHLIFSYSTFDSYKNRCIHFAKYCKKEFEIKQLNEIKAKMIKSYFEERKDLSNWTKKSDYSAISKLENALKNRNWISKDDSFQVDMKELAISDRKLKDRKKGGPYSDKELDSIKKNITSENAKEYVDFIEASGARIHEALQLKLEDIDFTNSIIRLTGKGGKERHIKADKTYLNALKQKIRTNDSKNKVFADISARAVEKAVEKACKKAEIKNKGVHSIRANVAVKRYNKLRSKGYSENDAKKKISNFLGHNRKSVLRYYLN